MAQNDGFALLTRVILGAGTVGMPSNSRPVAEIIRYKGGVRAWATPVNGPGVHDASWVYYILLREWFGRFMLRLFW